MIQAAVTRGSLLLRASLAFAVLACLGSGGVCAAPNPGVELANPAAQGLDAAFTIGVADLVAEIRLRNTAPDARSYRTGVTLLRSADGSARPARWTRLDGGSGVTIEPGAEAILQLSALLPEPGVYETWIDTATLPGPGSPAQPDRRVHVAVTREAAVVPADFIVEPRPMHAARWPWDTQARTILIDLANTTPKPVEFLPPAVLGFAMRSGDEQVSAAAPLPQLDSSGCASPLAPGGRCALRLGLGGGFWPGQYAVDIGVVGPGGGPASKTATLFVRLPLLAAFVVSALGVGSGWLVQEYRATGRRALSGLIDLGLLRRRIASVVDTKPGVNVGSLAAPILDAVAALEVRARAGVDCSAAIAALSDRIDRLTVVASVERAFRPLQAEARVMLAAPHTRFAQQAAAAVSGQVPDGYDATAAAMAQMVNDWPGLAAARAAAAAQLARLQQLTKTAGETQASATLAADGLQTAIAASVASLPQEAPASAVSDRAVALQSATATAAAKLQTLGPQPAMVAFKAAAGSTEGQMLPLPGATPADLDLPTAIAFALTPDRSPESLARERRLIEWATNLIILAAISLTGVVLVGNNPVWGSPVDVIGLFLAGFGSRVVISALGAAAQPLSTAL